jgi:hypothetical protein
MTWLIANITWSVGFSALSALIWMAAAFIPIPKTAYLIMGVGGSRPSQELDAILYRLRWQACFNAAAAFCMAVSVILQVVKM